MNRKSIDVMKVFVNVIKDLFCTHSLYCIGLIIFLILSSFGSLVMVKFIEYITEIATLFYDNSNIQSSEIVMTISVFVIVLLASTLVVQLYEIFKIHFQKQVDEHLSAKLRKKLSRICYEYYETSVIFEKLNRVNEKLVKGYQTVMESIVKVIEILCYIVIYAFYLTKVNVYFAVFVVVSIVFSGIMATRMSSEKNKMFVDVTRLQQKRDYLNQIPREKAMHQEYQTARLRKEISKKYEEAYIDTQKAYLKIHWYTILAESKALLLFVLTILCTYSYLAFQILDGKAAVGSVISFMLIFDTLYKKSEALSYYIARRVEDMLIVREYYEIMDYTEMTEQKKESIEAYSIQAVNISYKYPQSEKMALDGLNLNVRQGEKIAIVGENGSGKSTFTNIVLGLLTQFDGNLIIGGETYSRQNPPPVGLVKALSQDFAMYQLSIKENILLGKDNVTDHELEGILELAGVEKMVYSLPEKAQTKLGQLDEGGVELSKGQEQRLAAARMIANSDVPIWIFDEPTAFLDPLAEIDMYKFLYSFSNEKTMFFISHRLGFAPMADRIIVFHKGRAEEVGSHEELMQKNGRYAQMYAAQKSWYE